MIWDIINLKMPYFAVGGTSLYSIEIKVLVFFFVCVCVFDFLNIFMQLKEIIKKLWYNFLSCLNLLQCKCKFSWTNLFPRFRLFQFT